MTEETHAAIDRAIDQTLKELGIRPKTRRSKVSMNYIVTKMGIGRVQLTNAIRKGQVRAELHNRRWSVDRKSVEEYFNLR